MAQRINQGVHAAWRKRIERQQRSGQTVAEFCRHEGVSAASFYYWKRTLRPAASPRSKRATARRKTAPPKDRAVNASDSPGDIPFVQLPLPTPAACPWIEVVLAEGTVVRLPQQNLAALQAVLGTLSHGVPCASIEGVRRA